MLSRRCSVVLAVLPLCLLMLSAAATAATINVPADQATIQAGINAASNGDTVVVSPGTYNEQISFMDKSITVRSTQPTDPATVAATIIDGGGSGGGVVVFANYSYTGAVIEGFTITNGNTDGGGGVGAFGGIVTIANNVITGNTAFYGGGIYTAAQTATIRNNTITNNTAPGSLGGGIFCYGGTVVIENNTICGNSSASGGGVYNQTPLTISNSIIAFNTGGGLYDSGQATISYCDVYDNTGGDYLHRAAPGTGCLSKDPLFANTTVGDFSLKSQAGRWNGTGWTLDTATSPCIDAGNPASAFSVEPAPNGGRINMGAAGNTAYASKSCALPAVMLCTPRGSAIPVTANIYCRFNTPMKQASVQNNFYINGQKVTDAMGTFIWVGTKCTFNPAQNLQPNRRYQVRVARAALSKTGLRMAADKIWNFTTAPAAATAVAVSSVPTASGAQITVSVASAADVTIVIRNLAGREIAILRPGQLSAGVHSLLWNGKSSAGTSAAGGLYLVQVSARAESGPSCVAMTSLRR